MQSAALHAVRSAFVTVTVVGLTALLSGRVQTPTAVLGKPFAYDPARPLEIRETVLERMDDVVVYDISYDGAVGSRVTALLVTPVARGRHPTILFGHWGGGDRSEFLPEAIWYARAGVVSLLPSYPWTRPQPWRTALRYSADPAHDFDVYVRTVIDLRRGVDLLVARSDVDARRLGYVGHSYGAQWGAILGAVDRRFGALVLMTGVPDLDALYVESGDPDYVELRTREPERVARLLAVMAPLAAVRYITWAAPASLLFQCARYEQMFPQSATDRYYAAASTPKSLRCYPTAHDLNDPQALVDRASWLAGRLGFTPVPLPRPR